jgi:hypothetical protein
MADNAALEPSSYPLIVYIHVPKTAGSTVKTILGLCTQRGHGNIEYIINDRAAFLNVARDSERIAGHIQRDTVAERLTWLGRPIEYFSCVREPVAQLVSHLNFTFERYSKSNYYDLHSLEQQRFDASVVLTDFSNPTAVMNLLLGDAFEYLNSQSRHVLGCDFADISDNEIARRLATYTYVASEYDLPKLYRAFGFLQLPEGVDEIRENVSKRHFDAQVFDSPQLREFLAHHHKHDLRLYAAVRDASWPAEGRRPFRPAFLPAEVFTFENFNERLYLDSNPDVAADVERGGSSSGYDHFLSFGCNENRRVRRWVLPQTTVARRPASEDGSVSSALAGLKRLRSERARIVGTTAIARSGGGEN